MQIIKYIPLLLSSLLSCVAWVGGAPEITGAEPPIRTDQQVYSVTRLPPPDSAIKVLIKILYTNRSERLVHLPGCAGPHPIIEKKIGDKWVPVLSLPVPTCFSLPITIEPGGTFNDKVYLYGYPPGKSKYPELEPEMDEVDGTYRIVYEILQTDGPAQPLFSNPAEYLRYQLRNPNSISLLPLEERISNEFRLTDQQQR
ncbi:MAG TPA: hypothetical protein VJ302_24075 [Blastocatellia bacterium]|nr:hypothetical protein [Blastocatellia bacterium]